MARDIEIGERFERLVVIARGQQAFRLREGKPRLNGWMWVCKCDCGETVVVSGAHLRRRASLSGCVSSCGCLKREAARHSLVKATAAWKLPPGESSFRLVLRHYKNAARKRNLSWSLTDDQARMLFAANCFYCGKPPSNITNAPGHNGAFVWNGIDRIDPAIGYEVDNVVTSCSDCNFAKQSMTTKSFLELVEQIYSYRLSGQRRTA